MALSFLPEIIYPSLNSISMNDLFQQGIQLLMLDFDNTIVPYTTNVPTQEMKQWLQKAIASPIQLCVVSNSRNERVLNFCEKYGIDCITLAKKPFSRGIKSCLDKYEVDSIYAALVGDQIFTDVLGANCAGVHSILIPAIHNHTLWLKLRHIAELPFILLARGRRA